MTTTIRTVFEQGFLTKLFLFGNFFYGLGFLAFSNYGGVTSSSLFQSQAGLYTWLPHIWGSVLMLAAVLAWLASYRSAWYTGNLGAALGGSAWCFAALVYLQTGYTLVFITVGLLYLGFWIYFYFKYVSDLRS